MDLRFIGTSFLTGKEFDLNRQCGVINPETKKICTRLLTCKVTPSLLMVMGGVSMTQNLGKEHSEVIGNSVHGMGLGIHQGRGEEATRGGHKVGTVDREYLQISLPSREFRPHERVKWTHKYPHPGSKADTPQSCSDYTSLLLSLPSSRSTQCTNAGRSQAGPRTLTC